METRTISHFFLTFKFSYFLPYLAACAVLLRVRRKSVMRFEGAHGLWELSVQKSHHKLFSAEALHAMVETLQNHCAPAAQTCVAAAMWCMFSTSILRDQFVRPTRTPNPNP